MSAPQGGEVRLNELYQEVILDHNRKPRNFVKLEHPTGYAHGVNPLCGDDFEVYLEADAGGTIRKIGFQGQGCAISKASASLMTTTVEGKSIKDTGALKDNFIRLLTETAVAPEVREGTGKLKFFEGVKQFPIRVKCATLAWRALEAALKGGAAREVTTEDSGERKREES